MSSPLCTLCNTPTMVCTELWQYEKSECLIPNFLGFSLSSACPSNPGSTAEFEFVCLLELRAGEGEFVLQKMNGSTSMGSTQEPGMGEGVMGHYCLDLRGGGS